jgi:hypothetical protein
MISVIFRHGILKLTKISLKLIPAHMYNDRPVGQIFIKLVHDLFGYNYQLQHLIIFLVHCINGVLLYFLILTIKKKADRLCLSSMLIVMLFLAWPKLNIPAEWISAIFDLLGLSLSLLYLLVHFSQWGVIQKKLSLILRLIILIMMSRTKESTLMIPLAAAAFDWFNLFLAQNKWRAIFQSVMIKNIVPVCFSVVYIAYLKYLQTLNPMGFVAPDHPYLSSLSPIVLLKNIFKYCYLFFNLNDWATSYRGYNLVGLGILFIVLALFVGMIFILTKDRQRYWGLFVISLFILTLLPVLPLVNMQHKLYLYIPAIFIFIGLALQIEWFCLRFKVEEKKIVLTLQFLAPGFVFIK